MNISVLSYIWHISHITKTVLLSFYMMHFTLTRYYKCKGQPWEESLNMMRGTRVFGFDYVAFYLVFDKINLLSEKFNICSGGCVWTFDI